MMNRKKAALGTVAGVAAVGAVAVAGVVVTMPAGVDGRGAMRAELQSTGAGTGPTWARRRSSARAG
jgi:hypothetical protein